MPFASPELDLASALLECLQAALMANPNPPAKFCLRVGDEVRQDLSLYEDECCEGLAYVKINQVFATTDFPAPDEIPTVCGAGAWGVDLEMGVFRCAPVGDASTLPTCAQWTNTAGQVALDAAAMRGAVACFRGSLEPGDNPVVRPWLPLASAGGCAGGTQTVTVPFFDPC